MAGPEFGLFASRAFYDPRVPVRRALEPFSNPTPYSRSIGLYRRALPAYGLDERTLVRIRESAESLSGFFDSFAQRYLALRGKRPDGVVFEKTPDNLYCAAHFLRSVESGRFIHVVRNPIHVYLSLLRRGYPDYIALCTWLVAMGNHRRLSDHERVLCVRYEDIIGEPHRVVERIMTWLGHQAPTKEALSRSVEGNAYRRLFETRVGTWSRKGVGRVESANRGIPDGRQREMIAAMMTQRISPHWARSFDCAEISFTEAVEAHGYLDDVLDVVDGAEPTGRGWSIDRRSSRRLLKKCLRDLTLGGVGVRAIPAYFRPTVTVRDSRPTTRRSAHPGEDL